MRAKVLTRCLVLIASASLVTACSTATPEQQFVNDAAAALGGADRLTAVRTFSTHGTGRAFNLGQDMTWEAADQAFQLSEVERRYDLAGPRLRIEQTRTPNFLYFQGPQPQRQILGVDGDVAYSVGAKGNATRQPDTAARDRRAEFYHHPLTIVRAMLDSPSAVRNVRTEDTTRTADVAVGDVTFTLTLNPDGSPSRIASPSYHPNLGDVTITTTFSEYQDVDGHRVPMQLATEIDGHRITELQVTRYEFGGPDAAAPTELASSSPPTPPAPKVDVIPVADGIWLLGGQSHHSALIEFADHLTLFEAPQSEARALAVIARARELVPAKPLTELILSHHHFDHSGGLRAAVAEGLAVIAHKGNAAFVKEMVSRPHTRQPDALQRQSKPLDLRVVDDELTLQDARQTVRLYPIPGNPHSDTMVMAYVPASRVLIEVDAYSPGGTYHPYAANLLEVVRQRKLAVDRIVPLHGSIVSFASLAEAAAASSSP